MYEFDLDISTEKYTIEIDTCAKYGYFEHKVYGDERGGGLWFDDQNMLMDCDGTSSLPTEVRDALIKCNRIYPDQHDHF